ncbi:MAG TPA: hypothetical protein VLU25_17155 [Acidobacteriota bacterium]|nr:hypothetical protein [Acidobacteriota bacterium]
MASLTKVMSAGLLISMIGCRPPTELPPELGHRYRVYVDQTGSTPSKQKASWPGIFRKDFFPRLGPGDRLEIYAIHDRTSEAPALLIEELPSLSLDAGITAQLGYQRALAALRTKAERVFEDVLDSDAKVASTSVLGLIDSYKPDSRHRPTRIVLFSDMLESSDTCVNLERTAVHSGNLEQLAGELLACHDWEPNVLQGVEIYCIVRAYFAGDAAPKSSRRHLEAFWSLIFSRLGAELKAFDTHLAIAGPPR